MELCWLSAVEMVELFRKKALSPLEVMKAVLKRVEEVNASINAICTLAAEEALKQAAEAEKKLLTGEEVGPLHGVPVTIKDLNYTRGIRTTFGSVLYKDFVPEVDDIVVERLKKAGAIVFGKTNVPEFGLIGMTDNNIFGKSRNPWHLDLTTGGSSGGAAAAAVAGIGPLHHGNDGGGSIRIPAAFCGVYGIKPQFGRVPSYPRSGMFESLSCEGPITRTVADAALMLNVIAGCDARDRRSVPVPVPDFTTCKQVDVRRLRMAWAPTLNDVPVEKEVKNKIEEAINRLVSEGWQIEEIKLKLENTESEWMMIVLAEVYAVMEPQMEEWQKVMYPYYQPFISLGASLKVADLVRAQLKRELLYKQVQAVFERWDVLLLPVLPVLPFPAGQLAPTTINGQPVPPTTMAAFTIPFNMTDQPAASLPCGFTDSGLPVGMQVVGRPWDEMTVLAVSAAIEEIMPWQGKHPPL